MSTIIQLATPRVQSSIHIIRISGPDALSFLQNHTVIKKVLARTAHTTHFYRRNPPSGELIDYLIALYYPAPNSYTGEEMVELQCHGSTLIVDQILQVALQDGLELAQPGEFTFRSYLNKKITLEGSEAIDALIKSTTKTQQENALNILEKKSSLKFDQILSDMLNLLAEMESTIEFPEEDIPEIEIDQKSRYQSYLEQCRKLKEYFLTIRDNYDKGRKLEEGIHVMLIGPPNAGKSTLMNLLLREDRSIISDQAGTTRDYLNEAMKIDGFQINLFDTAGLHDSDHSIEKVGIERTKDLLHKADLILALVTGLDEAKDLLPTIESGNYQLYLNKKDRYQPQELEKVTTQFKQAGLTLQDTLSLTKSPKEALSKIENNIRSFLTNFQIDQHSPALLNERQAGLVGKIIVQLGNILAILKSYEPEELLMEEFKIMIDLLNKLNLKVDQELIFDRLFSNFCLGK